MAAHVLTALREARDTDMSLDILKHGLSYAKFGDELDLSDWQFIYYATDMASVKAALPGMIAKYETLWHFMDEPTCAEMWDQKHWVEMTPQERHDYNVILTVNTWAHK